MGRDTSVGIAHRPSDCYRWIHERGGRGKETGRANPCTDYYRREAERMVFAQQGNHNQQPSGCQYFT